MGRQLRFFLLAQETEDLLRDVLQSLGGGLYADQSSGPDPEEVQWPLLPHLRSYVDGKHHFPRFYLAPPLTSKPQLSTYPINEAWHLDTSSDVIECDACSFDHQRLFEGRLYYQADRLVGDAIVPRSLEFVRWSESIFRLVKKQMKWSAEQSAWIGSEALRWQQQGGQFVDAASRARLSRPSGFIN
jgi:hypothetical protein